MKIKREPLLCDKILNSKPFSILPKPFVHSTLQGIRLAKRFVLSHDAAHMVAEMVRDMPRVIADAQDFAIPPFDLMWIEFPFRDFWETVTGRSADHDADTRIGYLINGTTVRECMCADGLGADGELAGIMPMEYHLHHPLTAEQEIEFCRRVQVSRITLDNLFWGEQANAFRDDPNKEALRSLRNNHGFTMHSVHALSDPDLFDMVVMRSGGTLRNLIAILLFLNRTRDLLVTSQVPHQQAMIGLKPGVLLRHSLITLRLNPTPRLLTLVPGQGVWRRLHDVRGHFCHDKRARAAGHDWCAHDWEETDPLHWQCTKCHGKRWWRHEHKRGHEDKGLVTSEYSVVA
jgi:hypothetical protein